MITRRGDMIQRKPNTPWYIEARIKPAPGQLSKRHRISTGCTDYQDALRVGADLKSQLLANVHTWRKKVPTFGEWWDTYIADYTKVCRSPLTLRAKLFCGKSILPVFGDVLLPMITRRDCETFRDTQLKDGYANATVAQRCAQMHAVLEAAVNANLLVKNPWAGVAIPSPKRRQRVLTDTELDQLLLTLDAEIAAAPEGAPKRKAQETKNFVIVLLGTLLRITTGTRITRAQLATLKEQGHFDIVTKGGKVQKVIRLPDVLEALECQSTLRPHSKVRLFPVTAARLRDRLTAVRKRAGIDHFTPHDFRRTSATRLMKGDPLKGIIPIPLPLLMQITGHSKIDTLVASYTVAEFSAVAAAWLSSAGLLALGTNRGTTPKTGTDN